MKFIFYYIEQSFQQKLTFQRKKTKKLSHHITLLINTKTLVINNQRHFPAHFGKQ